VYLAPLFLHASGRSSIVSFRLRRALQWWLRFLPQVPVRIVPCIPTMRTRVIMYTDAAGDGCMAWVLHVDSLKLFAACRAPRWLTRWVVRRKVQIATWELIAALCGLWHIIEVLRLQSTQLDIRIFIDSAVALGTLLRGSSRQRDWNLLTTGIWFETARRGMLLSAWRVPSRQNLADAPTRMKSKSAQMNDLMKAGFREVDWKWPHAWLGLQ
jgi:hypothetical protein